MKVKQCYGRDFYRAWVRHALRLHHLDLEVLGPPGDKRVVMTCAKCQKSWWLPLEATDD